MTHLVWKLCETDRYPRLAAPRQSARSSAWLHPVLRLPRSECPLHPARFTRSKKNQCEHNSLLCFTPSVRPLKLESQPESVVKTHYLLLFLQSNLQKMAKITQFYRCKIVFLHHWGDFERAIPVQCVLKTNWQVEDKTRVQPGARLLPCHHKHR